MPTRFSQNPTTGAVECYDEDGKYKGNILTIADAIPEYTALYGNLWDLPNPKAAIAQLTREGFWEKHPDLAKKYKIKLD